MQALILQGLWRTHQSNLSSPHSIIGIVKLEHTQGNI